MSTVAVAQGAPRAPGRSAWLWDFLKEELAPYPGRAGTVARMVVAATLAMIICMTFRIPYGFQAAIFALFIPRESPRATLASAGTMLLVSGVGAAYILIGAWFVINLSMLHFVWNIVSFFAVFYAISTMTKYGVAVVFAIIVSVGVPVWDRPLSAETNVEDTLWLILTALIGVVVTAAVELVFARVKPGDDVVLPIAERLAAVQGVLACYLEDRPVDDATERTITRLGMLGTSTLRGVLRRSEYSWLYKAQMSGVGALVDGLVEVTATLTQPGLGPSGTDHKRLGELAATIGSIRTDLVHRRIPGPIQFIPDAESLRGAALVREMQTIVALIPQAFAGSRSMDEYLPASDDRPRSRLVAPDALTNPEHLKFALRGCLAASVCYIIYNSIAWPGISTAVTTCLLTALSTIGGSRQKQTLRVTGALAGGPLIGMGSQMFILPYLDSIAGFTVLFILVTIVACWFITSGPRLSYFGVQLALAFYLIHLQEFAMQTSLSIARDRVVGILLGLFMMWLAFDQLWGAPAAVAMKRAFISNLRLLAQLARDPMAGDRARAILHASSLRATITATFDNVRSSSDAVLFEFGSSRQQDLALRSRIKHWQSQLRPLFLTRNALLKQRLQLPGFELPESVRLAQQEFDDRLAKLLDGMADRVEGKALQRRDDFADAFERLEQTVRACCSEGPQESLSTELQSFLALSRSIATVAMSLEKEI
jgi:multidrug resistance protein MdtO